MNQPKNLCKYRINKEPNKEIINKIENNYYCL